MSGSRRRQTGLGLTSECEQGVSSKHGFSQSTPQLDLLRFNRGFAPAGNTLCLGATMDMVRVGIRAFAHSSALKPRRSGLPMTFTVLSPKGS